MLPVYHQQFRDDSPNPNSNFHHMSQSFIHTLHPHTHTRNILRVGNRVRLTMNRE